MMRSIVFTAWSLTTLVSESACSASVRPARCTASLASSDFGLNSFFSRAENSSSSAAAGASRPAIWVSFAMVMASLLGVRLRRLAERLQELRILQRLLDQVLGAGLAVHVGQQVRELSARLEQLVQRIDLARDRRGREVVHALEGDVEVDVAFAGERVRHLAGDARLLRLEERVEVGKA